MMQKGVTTQISPCPHGPLPDVRHNPDPGLTRARGTMRSMKPTSKKVFIPFCDEILDHPELLYELVPYQAGYPLLPGGGNALYRALMNSSRRSPGARPSSEPLPAFNSRTYIAGPSLG